MKHHLALNREHLHGTFSTSYAPVLYIESGDSVQFQTLDAGWGYVPEPGGPRVKFEPRDSERDRGHALCGPVHVAGAEVGKTLAVRIDEIVPSTIGWNSAGGWPNWQSQQLGIADKPEVNLTWDLDVSTMIGRAQVGGRERSVTLRPFMGVLGMPPAEPGIHSTIPPRPCGGNLDCKELVKGSTLYLPVSVSGALFSVGDGHAAQGDGEVSGLAIECPMDRVDLTLSVLDDMSLTMPRAHTPAGWITYGLDEDLNVATVQALDGMLVLMGELFGVSRREAMALASLAVDLRVTQIVNQVKGVHAVLPHGAIR